MNRHVREIKKLRAEWETINGSLTVESADNIKAYLEKEFPVLTGNEQFQACWREVLFNNSDAGGNTRKQDPYHASVTEQDGKAVVGIFHLVSEWNLHRGTPISRYFAATAFVIKNDEVTKTYETGLLEGGLLGWPDRAAIRLAIKENEVEVELKAGRYRMHRDYFPLQ